jgi:hypothetical protein
MRIPSTLPKFNALRGMVRAPQQARIKCPDADLFDAPGRYTLKGANDMMNERVFYVVAHGDDWVISEGSEILGTFQSQVDAIDRARIFAGTVEEARILVQRVVHPPEPDWTPDWMRDDPHDAWDAPWSETSDTEASAA